jgi:hypothetical protein
MKGYSHSLNAPEVLLLTHPGRFCFLYLSIHFAMRIR